MGRLIPLEIKKIEGIIVGEKSFGESSKILDLITKEYGVISLLSKGSKRLKSTLRSVSQMFTYAEFEISYKKDKLSTLISADIIDNLYNIKSDIKNISYINFISELTKQVLRQSLNSKIYDIYISTILKINERYDPIVITNILELKYMDFLGVTPLFDGCAICGNKNVITLSSSKGGYVCKNHMDNEYIVNPKTIKLIKMLKYVDISKITKINISDEVKNEINNFIDNYYDRYTGLYLKSKEFLKKLIKI